MLKKLFNLFKSDITIIEPSVNNKTLINKIVRLYSRGSISLSNGRYITKEDIKEKQKELFSYNFQN